MTPAVPYQALGHDFMVAGNAIPESWPAALAGLCVQATSAEPAIYRVDTAESTLLALTLDGTLLATGRANDLFAWLMWEVRSRAARTTNLVVLHAAALERAGVLVLLPGRSGVGKSTLAIGLVRNGWTYLGDELVGIRPGSGQPVVCVTPPRLDADACTLLGIEDRTVGTGKNYVRPDRLFDLGVLLAPVDGKDIRTRFVMMLERSSDGFTQLLRCSPLVAAAELAECVFAGTHPAVALDSVLALTQGAYCGRLRSGRLDTAIECVEQVISDAA